MFDCNQDVTIYNMWQDPKTLDEVFIRHVIPVKCKWKNKVITAITGNTANIANSIVVVIPYSEFYRNEETWQSMSEADRKTYFTLQNGDTMILGVQDTEITGISPNTETEIKDMFYPHSMTIKAYQDNTISAYGKHYKVEGV